MQFAVKIFTLAKDPEHPEDFQDACHVDAARGIAAVADGVASAIFSGPWAELLTQAVVADTPDPGDKESFARWLQARRQDWAAQIDVSRLSWFQKPKLPTGAFSTLLWVHVSAEDEESTEAGSTRRLQGFAIGDSCLLHVRGGELLRAFPVQQSAEFDADPLAVGSVDLKRDQLLSFLSLEDYCQFGDLLVLCTDAVACWALQRCEQGCPPAWEQYWQMTEQGWRDEIIQLREQGSMRYDDATLLLLRIGAECDEVPAEAADEIWAEVPQAEASPVEEPPPAAEPDWAAKLKALSDQAYQGLDEVSQQMVRGMRELKQKAVEKLREKFGSDEK